MHTPFIPHHNSVVASPPTHALKIYFNSLPSLRTPLIIPRFTIYLDYIAILLSFIAYLFNFPSPSSLSFYFTLFEILHFISRLPPLYVAPHLSTPLPIRMPPRGHRTAPTFDPGKPRELKRYFSELEFHFDAANVTDNTEKKNHATRYVDFNVAEIWESLPSFSDPSATYNNFRAAVFELYPAAGEEYKYTLADVDFLIAHRLRSDVTSLADLADYHAHFLAITNFLVSKQRLSEIEQQRAYPRGFPPALRSKVEQRLRIKFIDHLPDDPYPISDVYAAARFVLHTTRSASPSSSSIAPSPPNSSIEPIVNTEQLGTLFNELTKSIIAAIDSTHRHPRAAPSLTNTAPRTLECRFCGKEHFIRNCELVEEYNRAGKLMRNIDGKVVLPTGALGTSRHPGRFLKECIDEWHRRHPGHLAAPVEHSTILHSASTPCAASSAPTPSHTRSQAAVESRIAEIEAEIARLRSKRPAVASPISSRLQPFRAARADNSDARIISCAAYFTSRPVLCSLQPHRVNFVPQIRVPHCRIPSPPTSLITQHHVVRFQCRLCLAPFRVSPHRQIMHQQLVVCPRTWYRRFPQFAVPQTTFILTQNMLTPRIRSQEPPHTSHSLPKTRNIFYRRLLPLPSSLEFTRRLKGILVFSPRTD